MHIETAVLIEQAAESAATRALEKALEGDHICRLKHITVEEHRRHHEAFENFMAVMGRIQNIKWGVLQAVAIAGAVLFIGWFSSGMLGWIASKILVKG